MFQGTLTMLHFILYLLLKLVCGWKCKQTLWIDEAQSMDYSRYVRLRLAQHNTNPNTPRN